MSSPVNLVVSYAVNAVWQSPLLAAAGWLGARLLQRWGPSVQHRVWVATLIVSVLTPMFSSGRALLHLTSLHKQSATAGGSFASLSINAVGFNHSGVLVLPLWLIATIFVLYSGSLLFFTARLSWLLAAAQRLARSASPEVWTSGTSVLWQRARQAFAPADATVLTSAQIHGIMTIGGRGASILLPVGFTAQASEHDLLTALGHEMAHVERRDYAKNLLYELASIAVAFHPATWFVKSQIVQTREMICDALVVDRLVTTKAYRESLLRLAQRMVSTQPATVHAVGMFDANILEKRIMMMKQKRTMLGSFARAGLAGCAAVLLAGAIIATAAFARPIGAPSSQDKDTGNVYKVGNGVSAPVLKKSVDAEFPKSAKLPKGQSAICLIGLVVDRDGMPRDVHVTRSAGKDFDSSAIQAVEQYQFTPAMRSGNPVAVSITIEVNFKKY